MTNTNRVRAPGSWSMASIASMASVRDDASAAVRGWIANGVRSRVMGDTAPIDVAGERGAAQPGWMTAGGPSWTVHSDAAMFVGGIRALLLQSMHPVAMTAVAQHSQFRDDPWGRLARTAQFLAATTFGSAGDAEAACRTVRTVHRRVRGVTTDGVAYRADDPHLLAWVHAAELDSFLRAHQRYGRVRLDPAGCDAYVAEQAVVAARLGVVDPPRTVDQLRTVLASFAAELGATSEARAAARFVVAPPGVAPIGRPMYLALVGAAVAMLPRATRRDLRLPPPVPLAEAAVGTVLAGGVLDVLRWALDPGSRAGAA
jgi:uncharacterized protein (DUF2236 family)